MKKNLIVLQNGYKECGASCLLSIIRYYGGNTSISKLLELTHTDKTGTDFYNLQIAAKTIGLSSKAYKIDNPDLLKEINLPIICQIIENNYEHFIVIYSINNRTITVMDPAYGKKVLTNIEFCKLWTGYVMVFSPIKKLPIFKEEKYLNKVIIETILNNKSIILNILLLSMIFTVASCIYAFYNQIIIDNIINTTTSNLTIITFIFSIVILIKCISNYFRNIILIYISQKIDCSLFLNTFQKILLLPYNYYKNRTTGEVISRINDLTTVKTLFSKIILTVFLDVIISIVCGILLIKINRKMFMLLVIIIIEYIIIYLVFRPIAKQYTNIFQENNAQISSKMIECISGFETIKNLNIEKLKQEEIEKLYVSSLNDIFIYDNLSNFEIFINDIVSSMIILLTSLYGYSQVMNNVLSIGSVITFISLTPYFVDPLKKIIELSKESFYSINAIKRVNDLFNIDCENLDSKTTLNIKGDIKFNDLTFSYNNCDYVLNNINFNVCKGDRVLLLGTSGSGKSTILKLIYKYYKIKRSMIYIDDIDINDYALEDIRKKVVYISQEETIFTDTIKNNIILNRNINYEDFLEICKLTFTDEIVKKLFLGYDTKLEENGLNLSGGQRQRIILARALLKESNIILIDEGLNAIDVDLERKILKNIFSKYVNKTIIIVSHRTENIDLYNKVIKLKNGIITEEIKYPQGDIYD